MSGRLGDYLELVQEAERKRLRITRSQKKQIAALYSAVADDLERQLRRHSENSLSARWLNDYAKALRGQSTALYREIGLVVESNMLATAKAVVAAQEALYSKLAPELSERFSAVFSRIPQQAVNELLNGGIYRDFAGLSERLWNYKGRFDKDIQSIINQGVIAKKSAYDLAKDLEKYLKPGALKPWDWNKVYPGCNRAVDYSAQRLARTSVTHAYQLSFQRATQDNPFVTGYKWLASNSARVCSLCAERDGQIFEKDFLPLDHPNGMCAVMAVIPKSLDQIGEELHEWAMGGENPALDQWLNPKQERGMIKLTDQEEYALNAYISSASYPLNAALRHRMPLTPEQVELMRGLDAALEKLPIYQGTVYRSLDATEIEDVDAFVKGYRAGETIPFHAYTSSGTRVYDPSFPIQYVIQSKTGRDLRSLNPEEYEILFPREVRFKVQKVEGHTIYLEEA